MTSKYHNRGIRIDGFWFNSEAEGQRYLELRLMEKAGEIRGLEVHPRYELVPPHADGQGVWQGGASYEADFAYSEGDRLVVEDVKGALTQLFVLKAKLFTWLYPQIVFRIVRASGR